MNPLTIGVRIIIQALILAFITSFFLPSFWFSYILILVYLGGLLVLFIYVSSLASNEQINSSIRPLVWTFILAVVLWNLTPELLSAPIASSDSFEINTNFLWIFSSSSLILAGALMVYLFFALVAVVKITKWWGGSLRPQKIN